MLPQQSAALPGHLLYISNINHTHINADYPITIIISFLCINPYMTTGLNLAQLISVKTIGVTTFQNYLFLYLATQTGNDGTLYS